MRQRKREIQYYHNYFRSQQQLFWKPTSIGNNRIRVVTMQRVRISSYAQKVGVVLARRAIRIVNKIHDVTMYNISSQSNALTTLDPEFLRMGICTSKKRSEYCKEIALRVEYSNNIERKFYFGRET